LLKAHPDKLVIVKFFAAYCRACKALDPKFIAVKKDPQLEGLPIVWAEFHSQRKNRDLFQKLRVLTLPTVQFYDGSRGLVENFPCGPAKVPQLKKKLAGFLNSRVDPETLQLKEVVESTEMQIEPPRVERRIVDSEMITDEHINYLRSGMPFLKDLTDEEFEVLLDKARLLTFNPGDVIIRQGMPGKTFYVLKSGVVEMSIKSRFDDPISTPPNYLGAVVNELKKFDYFGERALTTGEPYAASVRVVEKVRCFAFNVEDIPESSILSKKSRANRELVEQLSQRYELPEDYTPSYPVTPRDECVLELLVRFKQIRQAAKCFEYIMKSGPTWGNQGEISRRSMLVIKLSKSQKEEFQEVFNIVDAQKRGKISLLEMRKFMGSAREDKSVAEVLEMMARANPQFTENKDYGISRDEFMGVMAEAEFYNLFTETFQELDKDNTGYVRAGDLDEVLGGVRYLISDEKTSIIDVEDKDMLVDYEQFSKMLLGAAL
jgi:Ca2+-binding EF-hand superfamily protein